MSSTGVHCYPNKKRVSERVSDRGYPQLPLTDAKIRSAKAGPKPIKLTDSAGLYLEVRPTGAKLWRYRYRIAGRENVYAMGEYPTLSLSEARQRRSEARALVTKGIHPAKHRKAAQLVQQTQNATTFEAVTREWMEGKAPNCTPGYAQQVHRCFEAEVFPWPAPNRGASI